MASCLRKIVAPSVQPVLPQQKGVRRGKPLERRLDQMREALHVLVVLQNRQPLGVLVRRHALEPLQHLVAGDGQPSLGRMHVREDRAPDRMRMQNRRGAPAACDGHVQQRFGRGSAGPFVDGGGVRPDEDDVVDPDGAFRDSTGGDGQRQRLARHEGAEVAARPEDPPSRVKIATDLAELASDCRNAPPHDYSTVL